MPAPTTINAQRPHAPPKKTRIVRRRGRAHNGIYSDDEIEREARSDTSSDSDVSSLDSATDSETEPASEDVQHTAPAPPTKPAKPLLATPVDWSEMVTGEDMHGAADLPVIDFADLTPAEIERTAPTHAPAPQHRLPRSRSQKATKAVKPPARTSSAPPSVPSPDMLAPDLPQSEHGGESPEPGSSHEHEHEPRHGPMPPRRNGQTARQAYQERLESDPSYVPTVGEFWGHDDRLLDKDLRSLSGWWRGRWQGRGGFRGRGFAPRGRGAFFARTSGQPMPGSENGEPQEMRPSDREWTHDGFEEMKKRDDRRRLIEQPDGAPQRGGFRGGFRGARGGFVSGRGGRGGFGRGGFQSGTQTRTWFAMKPERVWTKHHELFLFSDPALKPRPGQGPGYRIKLPGSDREATVVHAPPRAWPPVVAARGSSSTQTAPTSDDGEKAFTVRLPPRASEEKVVEVEERDQEQVTTVEELSLDDAFTIKPPPPMIPIFPMSAPPAQASFSSAMPPSPPQLEQQQPVEPQQPSPSSAPAQGWITSSPPQPEETKPAPPVLPPLQTVFSPMAAPSPQFGSPYGFAPTPALPPGIVLNQHGMPYEMATGRPVYLQQPMYDVHPRGVLPPHLSMPPPPAPFVPQHLRHPSSMSVSPDFLAHPSPPPMFAETPIFAPPRQSSRIEIRKPTADSDTKKTASPRPSSLRSSVTSSAASSATAPASAAPSSSATIPAPRPAPPAMTSPQQHAVPEFYPTLSPNYAVGSPEQGPPPPVDVQMMGYPQYQQQYYYPPEQYGYAPPPSAYDMQHHPVQYDMYAPPQPQPPHPSDPRAQPVYY
ncbi:hypothetical protein DENSPDRAFT_273750 [Dentipellis sp. KUC8613]|nr:hypothetical protein DENSPDRAFT_273750 [Dentipellis sp. KUC8613]